VSPTGSSLTCTYTYDQAGNRLSKVQKDEGGQAVVTTTYTYDVQDPSEYGSQPLTRDSAAPPSNRLAIWSRVKGQGNRLVHEHTEWGFMQNSGRDTYYLYDKGGRVNYVIKKVAGDTETPPTGRQWYTGTQIWYNTQGLIWLAKEIRWLQNANGSVDDNSVVNMAAMEYRYDSARGRYRVQPRDPNTLYPVLASDGIWHDYNGNEIWGDYSIGMNGSTPMITGVMSHVPGLAQTPWTGSPPAASAANTTYVFGNQIGTTERLMNASDEIAHRAVFTAFGEPIYVAQPPSAVDTRYGYAGAWGYQEAGTGDPLLGLGWLHVGMRYYDPSNGRFVQRDPIGIEGGLNVYVYRNSNPLDGIDPAGLSWWRDLGRGAWDWGARAISVVRKIACDMTGQRAPISIGVITPVVKGLEAAPDCFRLYCAKKHLENSLSGSDINEDLDNWEKGHGKWVKPGSGN
jgi:RHS repeat-associated protein